MPSVTRKPRQPRDRRRAELRDQLLAAAGPRLADGENLAGIRVDELVAAAGVSRSTFYGYFTDRDDLLCAWFAELSGQLRAVTEACDALDAPPSRAALRDRLAEVMQGYRPHALVLAALYDAAAYEPRLRTEVATAVADEVRRMKRHIARGQKAGWIAANVPAETAAWLVWMVERGQNQLPGNAKAAQVDQAIDGLTDVLFLTLYAYA